MPSSIKGDNNATGPASWAQMRSQDKRAGVSASFGEQLREGSALVVASSRGLQTR